MKIFRLVLLTVFISLTLSCSSDDDSAPSNGNIAGVWKGTAVNYYGSTSTTMQGQTINADFIGEAYDLNYTLTFSENPNTVTSEGSYSIELKTTYLGQTTTQNIENLSFLSDGVWTRNGDRLSVTVDNETDEVTIIELSATKLVLEGVQNETVEQGGATVTSTSHVSMSFSRQ